jgi:hypothetical protein
MHSYELIHNHGLLTANKWLRKGDRQVEKKGPVNLKTLDEDLSNDTTVQREFPRGRHSRLAVLLK